MPLPPTKPGAGRGEGFFVPALVTILLVMLFVAALFGTRALNRAKPVEVNYSERYRELSEKTSLSADEQAELERESCRYRRDTLRFLRNKALANLEQEVADYKRDCEAILPLGN